MSKHVVSISIRSNVAEREVERRERERERECASEMVICLWEVQFQYKFGKLDSLAVLIEFVIDK